MNQIIMYLSKTGTFMYVNDIWNGNENPNHNLDKNCSFQKNTNLWIRCICVFFFLMSGSLNAHDSLWSRLSKMPDDTNKIDHCILLMKKYARLDSKVALQIGDLSLELCKKNKWAIREAETIHTFGIIYFTNGDYFLAGDTWEKCLILRKKINDNNGIKRILSNLGALHTQLGNYPKALSLMLQALRMEELMQDTLGAANSKINISNFYYRTGKYEKAAEYTFSALTMAKLIGNSALEATALCNLGEIYVHLNKPDSALIFLHQGMEMKNSLGDTKGLSIALGNFGNVFAYKLKHDSSLAYYLKAAELNQNLNNKLGLVSNLYNAGCASVKLNLIDKALNLFTESYKLSVEIGAAHVTRDLYWGFSDVYEMKGQPLTALKYYKRFVKLKDSLYNNEKNQEILKSELRYNFDRKAVADSIRNQEKEKIALAELHTKELEIKQANLIRYVLIFGLIVIAVFFILVYNRWKLTQKQKVVIEEQKSAVEMQKHLVEEKQKEILDSIHYARRIQMAQIPSEKRVLTILDRLKK